MNSKEDNKYSQEDFENFFKYLKNVLNINRTLSSVFMGITLTAFIFLVSLGFPDILELDLIIGGIPIKIISFSLSLLVQSFFFFLISTLLFYYSELKLFRCYFYPDSKLSSFERYEKSKKLHNVIYKFAKLFLFTGIIYLIISVIFIFLTFSIGGIILFILMLMILLDSIVIIVLCLIIKKRFTKKK